MPSYSVCQADWLAERPKCKGQRQTLATLEDPGARHNMMVC